MHLLKFTASNKENIIQRWNLQNCKKTEKPVKHDPDKHFWQNGSQDKQLHDQSATWPTLNRIYSQ